MSESAPERTNRGGNVFTRKIGPLPMWGWMAIAGLLAIFYYLYKKNQASKTAANTTAAANTTGSVDQSLVPQFVNQTYVEGTPPAAPNVTVQNTVPASTATPTTQPSTPVSAAPAPAQTTTAQAPAPTPGKKVTYIKYTVRPGDTLQSLSKKYGVTVADIAHAPGNVYVSGEVPGNKKVGEQLGTGAGLKTGMVLNIPQYS